MKSIALVVVLSLSAAPLFGQTPDNDARIPSARRTECERGFRRREGKCVAIVIPPNASLDDTGHAWMCDAGYVRRSRQCIAVADAADAEIRRLMIAESLASYTGRCPCPDYVDRTGRRCGRRSAYSRPGGASPLCYEHDISDAEVRQYRNRLMEATSAREP